MSLPLYSLAVWTLSRVSSSRGLGANGSVRKSVYTEKDRAHGVRPDNAPSKKTKLRVLQLAGVVAQPRIINSVWSEKVVDRQSLDWLNSDIFVWFA